MSVHERLEDIYAAERNHIYMYLLYCGVPPQRAQELAQDSFLKLYMRMTEGEPIENPRAWLYRVAHNAARRHHISKMKFRVRNESVKIGGARISFRIPAQAGLRSGYAAR